MFFSAWPTDLRAAKYHHQQQQQQELRLVGREVFVCHKIVIKSSDMDTDTCDWTAWHIVHLQLPLVMYCTVKTHIKYKKDVQQNRIQLKTYEIIKEFNIKNTTFKTSNCAKISGERQFIP